MGPHSFEWGWGLFPQVKKKKNNANANSLSFSSFFVRDFYLNSNGVWSPFYKFLTAKAIFRQSILHIGLLMIERIIFT
jgi:hypothetical protein